MSFLHYILNIINIFCCLFTCCFPTVNKDDPVEVKIEKVEKELLVDLQKVDEVIDTVEPIVSALNPQAGLVLKTVDLVVEKGIEIDKKLVENHKNNKD